MAKINIKQLEYTETGTARPRDGGQGPRRIYIACAEAESLRENSMWVIVRQRDPDNWSGKQIRSTKKTLRFYWISDIERNVGVIPFLLTQITKRCTLFMFFSIAWPRLSPPLKRTSQLLNLGVFFQLKVLVRCLKGLSLLASSSFDFIGPSVSQQVT